MSRVNLEGAELTITGNADGQPVTVTGKVKNVKLNVDHGFERYRPSYGIDAIVRDTSRYSIEFDRDDEGFAFKMQVKGGDVTRTARIEASDRTAAAIEKARVRAGAPENAKFRISDDVRLNDNVRMGDFGRMTDELVAENLDEPSPIMVEFYWKETVYR